MLDAFSKPPLQPCMVEELDPNESNSHTAAKEGAQATTDPDAKVVVIPAELAPEEEDQDMLADENMELETSLWDAALLVGVRLGDKLLFDWFTAVIVLVMTLVNSILQLLVVLAIPSSMGASPFEGGVLEAMASHRLMHNQRLDQTNLATLQTYTQQLCGGLAYNLLGDTTGNIQNYLQVDSDGNPEEGLVVSGVVVAAIAMLLWVLSMTCEFRRTLEVCAAIIKLDINKRHGFDVDEHSAEDCYVVARMTYVQKAFCFLVLSIRLTVASLLLIYGLQYLSHTVAVPDLILNACALEIVKDIDELMFDSMCSLNTKLLIENTRLKFTRPKAVVVERGLVLSRFAFVILVFVFGLQVFLLPFKKEIEEAEQRICHGDRDFVYAVHPVTNLPYFSNAAEEPAAVPWNGTSLSYLKCFYRAQYEIVAARAGGPLLGELTISLNDTEMGAILGTGELCEMGAGGHGSSACLDIPMSRLAELHTVDITEFASSPAECLDQPTHFEIMRRVCMQPSYSADAAFFSTFTTCADFAPVCTCEDEDTCGPGDFEARVQQYEINFNWIKLIRGVCPKSCGRCDSPTPAPAPSGGVAPASNSDSDSISTSPAPSHSPSPSPGGRRLEQELEASWQREQELREHVRELEQRQSETEQRLKALEELLSEGHSRKVQSASGVDAQ